MREFFIADVESTFCLINKGKCPPNQLPDTISRLFTGLASNNQDVDLTSPPRIYYLTWTPEESEIMAAFPVDPGQYTCDTMTIAGCKALNTTHTGPYEGLAAVWAEMWAEVSSKGMNPSGAPFDEYAIGPDHESDPNKWITELYIPLQL